jgi:ABC-type antimicrobial peptide transport system permease subunit
LGRLIYLTSKKAGKDEEPLQIVGVVPSVRNDLTEKALEPHVYVPFGQFYRSQMNIHLKTGFSTPAAEGAFLKTIREEIRRVDEGLPVLSLQSLRQFRDEGLLLWFVRTTARLFTVFAGLALLLAVIGLYGVKSFVVARRTREIGIRMALGATKHNVVWMVVREAGLVTLLGMLLGLLLALGTGRLLASFLYQVHGADPVVFSIASIVLILAALTAAYLPARRAAKVEPITALRYE